MRGRMSALPISPLTQTSGGRLMSLDTHKNPICTVAAAILSAAIVSGLTAPAGAQCHQWTAMPITASSPYSYTPLAMIEFNGELYAARQGFLSIRWNGEEWVDGPLPPYTRAMFVHDGELYTGGHPGISRTVGGGANQWELIGQLSNSNVHAIVEFEGDIIVGGNFSQVDGVAASRIARWDGSQWQAIGDGFDDEVLALDVYNGKLVAGGSFTASGDTALSRIAQWDGESWSPLEFGVYGDHLAAVRAMTTFNGNLIVGGRFTHAGGITVNSIAKWNGSTWTSMDGGLPKTTVHPPVREIVHYRDSLIVVGTFLHVNNDTSMRYVARWRETPAYYGWSSIGEFSGGGGAFCALGVNDDLYLGGQHTSINGDASMKMISRWNDGAAIIKQQPQHTQVVEGGTVILEVQPSSGTVITYSWLRNGIPLSEQNNGNASGIVTLHPSATAGGGSGGR
ncbi:MAG: hypothetical protein EA377_06310 [Phycisphaerales bacterium]|nr:MAG: hypothetical protein EA377_06310 [Phycisphaerales bacterium]